MNKSDTDDSGNLNTATESICPKGWTLPSVKQIDNNKDSINFNPILGGYYYNGTLSEGVTRGNWWGSEASNSMLRRYLRYQDNSLSHNSARRFAGFYIRCVSEEKTVTDLTYLQDMTGEIANNTLDGTTAN